MTFHQPSIQPEQFRGSLVRRETGKVSGNANGQDVNAGQREEDGTQRPQLAQLSTEQWP
jgi:hypothetical protein